MKAIGLAVGNFACWAIAMAIVFFAFRTWPTRYANHTLSWSVTAFFVIFVGLSTVGLIATAIHLRGRNDRFVVRLAVAPVAMLAVGCAIGLLKAALTGDF